LIRIEILAAVGVLGVAAGLHTLRLGQAAERSGLTLTAEADRREAVRAQLCILRCAIERYRQDHGRWPGCETGLAATGQAPAETLVAQLTRYTDAAGEPWPTRDARHTFGPYLRDGWPAWVDGREASAVQFVNTLGLFGAGPEGQHGWRYDCSTGQIVARLPSGEVVE
jgi:type II secretory pathway pseudopilin PulG